VVLGQQGDTALFGPVGTIQVLEGTDLVLFAIPGEAAYRPLWEALANGSVGGIVLTRAFPPFPPYARTSDTVLRLPFLVAGPGLDTPAEGTPLEWTPAVRWAVAGYGEGDEAGHLAAFRTFFSLILES
jgi:hypothetical protein